MLSATQLLEEHQDGDLDDRPQRVKRLRQEFAAYCDLQVPRAAPDVEEWYRSKRSVITRRLNEYIGGDEGGDD